MQNNSSKLVEIKATFDMDNIKFKISPIFYSKSLKLKKKSNGISFGCEKLKVPFFFWV
jgi:hypothetical protein